MLVSVIIPSYNYEKYIGQTLQSLIAQTHRDWEGIVVDDGSTDNTRWIVADFAARDNRIKYIYQQNAGQAAARNNGLRRASGKYIQFLDADDLLEPFKLERHVEFLEEHADVDLVYGETRYFRSEFPQERRYSLRDPDAPWMPQISGSGAEIIEKLIALNIFTISSPLTRRKIIETVGDFHTTSNLVEDWEYWMRCALANASLRYWEADGTKDLIRIHSLSTSQDLRRARYRLIMMRRRFNEILTDKELKALNSKILGKMEKAWIKSENNASIENFARGQFFEGIARTWNNFRFHPRLFGILAARKIKSFAKRDADGAAARQ